ncbi:MAG: hypothetical protein R3B99_32500 [Polyangiales bacterium]
MRALRLRSPGISNLGLHENALLAVSEDERHVIHLPSGATRLRTSRAASVALDTTGERAAVCDEGRLSLHSIVEGRRVADLGTCELADSLAFVAGDRMVRSFADPGHARSNRRRSALGGARARRRAYAEDGEHVLVTAGMAEKLRWRGPGAIATAPVGPPRPAARLELLRRFFAPPVP